MTLAPAQQPAPLVVNQNAINQLVQLGFQAVAQPVPQRVIAKIAGPEKTGKTHIALTCTQPIIFISIDIGTEGVVEKFMNAGRQILYYDVRIPRNASAADYSTMWTKMDQIIDVALQLGTGTIVFDSWTEMYELARLKYFAGRLDKVNPGEYPVVYADLREKIRRIYDSSMSAILLTKMAPEFGTRQLIEKGFGDTDFLVQANFITSRIDMQDPTTGAFWPHFGITVKDCRLNPFLNGMTFPSMGPNGDQFNMEQIIWLIHNWRPEPPQPTLTG